MIEICLFGKEGDLVTVDEHPTFLDFARRDSRTRTTEARIEIATENILAPTIARYFDGSTPMGVYPRLTADRADLTAKHPTREDGLRLIAELLKWHARWPEGRFHIAGAENVPTRDRFLLAATMPRFSERSLTADPLARSVRFVDSGERMDEMEAALDDLFPALEVDISGSKLLQREVRIQPTGGGSKSKGREKNTRGGQTHMTPDAPKQRKPREKSGKATVVVGVRVSAAAKKAIDSDKEAKREMFETVGLALASGKTYAEILAALKSNHA